MRHLTLSWLAVLFVASACAVSAQSQSNSPASAGATASNPAAAQPVAQSAAPATPATSAPAANASTMAAPAKKVWTNEDIGSLRGDSAISTFQPRNPKNNQAGRTSPASGKNRDAAWYRAQITKLEQQIPPLDAKIAKLQAGINGDTVNDPTTSSRPTRAGFGSWQAQLDDARQKRSELQSRIGELQDRARQSGIEPNQIP